MGTWGTKPWDSDTAADWFADVFEPLNIDAALEDAFKFDDPSFDSEYYDDGWDKVRSACYLLTVLGHSAYVWPGDLDRLDRHIERGLKLLRLMAAEGSEFREMWEDSPEILEELRGEIAALEAVA